MGREAHAGTLGRDGDQQFRRSARISRSEQRQITVAAAGLWAAQAWLNFGGGAAPKAFGAAKNKASVG